MLLTLVAGALVLLAPAASAAPQWGDIIRCESGGDFTAENPTSTASGGFQITDPTWQHYGGRGRHAAYASVSEQYRVAAKIHAAEGYRPWRASYACHGLR